MYTYFLHKITLRTTVLQKYLHHCQEETFSNVTMVVLCSIIGLIKISWLLSDATILSVT